MGSNQKRGIGLLLVQIALALYLAVTGLCMLGVGGTIKSVQATRAVYEVFNGDIAKFVAIGLGIVLLLCGIVLIVRMFADMHQIDKLLKFVSLIVWVAMAVIIDVLGFSGFSLEWVLNLSKDLLIIGGLMAIAD
ncbi:MAG: hypothetical protein K6G80_08635 [Treponema sp.]|nr:hypothetical protein [Treponema sp.]